MPGYLDGAINQEEDNSVPINRKNHLARLPGLRKPTLLSWASSTLKNSIML